MRRLVPALLALLLASGCSVQMAYNNLDRLARWSVSDYVDMTDSQRAYFDAALEDLWTWHRTAHLPEYAAFLDALAVELEDGTSEAHMQATVDRVVVWAEEIEARGMPVAAELLASLSDEQVVELAQTLEESNEEIAEDEVGVSAEAARDLWYDEFTDRFSQFSGRLTPVQDAYLRTQAAGYLPERVLWADYRRRWQADLLALLAFRADVDGFEQGLRQLSTNRHLYYGPELETVFDHNETLVRQSSVWLINSFTARQRQRFTERLTDLAEDFRELAAQETVPLGARPCLLRC